MSTVTQPAPAHRTPPAIRRALLAVAALLALALVVSGSFSLLDLASRHTSTERATFDGVRALVVEDASDVLITGGPAGEPATVLARVTEGLSGPSRSVERDADGVLRLSASCSDFLSGQCAVSYEVRVPSGTLVRADSQSGDVSVRNLVATEPVELHSSAGDVSAIDVTAPSIRLSSSAGDVEGRNLSGERIQAESSAGDVAVALRTPAERLVADSSAGDVEVFVPDAVYDLAATSSGGDVDARVRSDPDSPRELIAHSSAGDVRVAVAR